MSAARFLPNLGQEAPRPRSVSSAVKWIAAAPTEGWCACELGQSTWNAYSSTTSLLFPFFKTAAPPPYGLRGRNGRVRTRPAPSSRKHRRVLVICVELCACAHLVWDGCGQDVAVGIWPYRFLRHPTSSTPPPPAPPSSIHHSKLLLPGRMLWQSVLPAQAPGRVQAPQKPR